MQANNNGASYRHIAVPARAILTTINAAEGDVHAYGHVHTWSASGRLGEYLRIPESFKASQ